MKHLIISTSLNPNSNSFKMAKEAADYCKDAPTEFIDLRNYTLPHCDGGPAYGNPQVQELKQKIASSKGILLAAPIYNYNVCSSAKNLIELTGEAWTGKVVGFLFAAGGGRSYLAGLPIMNSLMIDFRCICMPRFVFAIGNDFSQNAINNPEVKNRIQQLLKDLAIFSKALEYATEHLTPAKHV